MPGAEYGKVRMRNNITTRFDILPDGDFFTLPSLPRLRQTARKAVDRLLAPAFLLLNSGPVGRALRFPRNILSRRARQDVGRALLRALGSRDEETAVHCSRVAAFAELIADELALQGEGKDDLMLACLLHDLGKLHVPLNVLHKPAALDDDEWLLMKSHAPDGERMVEASISSEVARIVGQHHERMDGCGYPVGLAGAFICLEARIVAVADAFDAMTSDRPYRAALEPAVAMAELRRASGLDGSPGGQFDPQVVAALAARFSEAEARCAATRPTA